MINTQSIFVRSTNLLLMPLVDSLWAWGKTKTKHTRHTKLTIWLTFFLILIFNVCKTNKIS